MPDSDLAYNDPALVPPPPPPPDQQVSLLDRTPLQRDPVTFQQPQPQQPTPQQPPPQQPPPGQPPSQPGQPGMGQMPQIGQLPMNLGSLIQMFLGGAMGGGMGMRGGGFRPPYIGARTRGWRQWGDPSFLINAANNFYPGGNAGPGLPGPTEALGVMNQAAQLFSQYGNTQQQQLGSQVANLAGGLAPVFDAMSKGAFSRNFAASRLAMLKGKQEEMQLAADQLLDATRRKLAAYKEIISTASYNGYAKDPAANAAEMHRRIHEIAAQTGDQTVENILNNQGAGAAIRYLDQEDAQALNLWGANLSSKKASAASQKDESWSEPAGGGQGATVDGIPVGNIQDPNAPKNLGATGGAAAGTQGPQKTDFGGYQSASDQQIAEQMGAHEGRVISPDGMAEAHSILNGIPSTTRTAHGPHDQALVDAAVNAMRGKINAIEQKAKMAGLLGDSADAANNEINQVDNSFGYDVAQLRGYQVDPGKYTKANKAEALRAAQAIDSGYNPLNYEALKKYYTDPIQKRFMARAAVLPQEVMNAVSMVNSQLKENQSIPMNWVQQGESMVLTGDPRYTNLYAAIQAAGMEIVSVGTTTGTPRVQLVHDFIARMPANASPAQIRGALQTEAINAFGTALQEDAAFRRAGGKGHAPGFSNDAMSNIDALARMNSFTGVMPEDSPPLMKAIGKPAGSVVGSWLHPNDPRLYKPLLHRDIAKAISFINANSGSTDKRVQDQVLYLRNAIPKIAYGDGYQEFNYQGSPVNAAGP